MQRKKVILYGAGFTAEKLLKYNGWKEYYQVVAIVDSDKKKHGKMLAGIAIMSLSDALKKEWDNIAVTVRGGGVYQREIRDTLDKLGIPEEKILSAYQLLHFTESSDNKSNEYKEKTGLVVIFNHRYEKNLPILRKLYGSRFSEIRFLMPFYTGNEPDVVPVYETSYCFQGFVPQAYNQIMEMDVEYFLFIADDLIINPGINEWNAAEKLGLLNDKEIFCFNFWELNCEGRYNWIHTRKSSNPFNTSGIAWRNELPTKEDAFALFREFMGKEYPREYSDELFKDCSCSDEEKALFYYNNGGTKEVPYPMAGGYSDLFAVQKKSLRKVSHMFGVLAAMNMFVEIAIPTAIVLTVKYENISFPEFSIFNYEKIMWENNDKLGIEEKYENNIGNLIEQFPAECMCIHPVKLSRWHI